jgi:UDP-N-acetylglucosamine 2-epimerase
MKVLSVCGTRPEVTEMAPTVRELARHHDRIQSAVCVAARHRQMKRHKELMRR